MKYLAMLFMSMLLLLALSGNTAFADPAPMFLAPPFLPGYDRADYHIIAYLKNHPVYEAVECLYSASSNHGVSLFGITTYHDKSQNYYFNDKSTNYTRHMLVDSFLQTNMKMELNRERTQASLSIEDKYSNRIDLQYQGFSRPGTNFSGIVNPQGHNPKNGIVLMFIEKSSIAVSGSRIRINDKPYDLIMRPDSRPPYWVGYECYLTEGLRYLYFNARHEEELSPQGHDPAIQYDYAYETNGNIAELRSVSIRNKNAQPVARMDFDPAYPNIRLLTNNTEVEIKFKVGYTDQNNDLMAGKIRIKKASDLEFTIDFLPDYPEWALKDKTRYSLKIFNDKVLVLSSLIN